MHCKKKKMMRLFYVGLRSFNTNPSSKSAHLISSVTIFTNIINTTCRCCHSLSFGASYNNEIKVESLHAKATKNGSIQHLDVSNHVLNLYARKYENLDDAHKLFDEMLNKDVRSWTIMISGFTRNGCHQKGLDFFRRMQIEGTCANQFTLSSVFKCCSSLLELRNGMAIHGWMLVSGIGLDPALGNSILDLYVKHGAVDYAERLFESMEVKDSWSCNVMLGGYLHNGDTEKSLELFKSLHCKDVASWNTIINGLIRNGSERIALELLYKVVENGPMFNAITFSTALHLFSCLSDLELGRQIHGRVLRLGMHYNVFIRNSLLDMYCKCGKMENASMVFREMLMDVSSDDRMAEIVCWSSMVAGCVQNGEYENALKAFCFMVRENIEVDKFTLTSIVSACTSTGVLDQGRQIHAYIKKIGHKVDVHMGSSLIDMYAKCGSFDDARKIFKQTTDLNVVLWTSMISGCALHGQGREAVRLFELMMNEKFIPNDITFICLLTACSHAGLLEEGCKYFKLMQTVYGINPGIEHYTCMVDLYGRAGRLNLVKEFIHENGISHLSAVWKSFLSCCRLHKNVEMGKWVSQILVQLEPFDPGPYVLLSNMLAADYSWEEAADVRSSMHQKNVNKLPGQSWIPLKNQVHTFSMDDKSHPQVTEIYSYLEKLIGRLKEIGYLPDPNPVMQDVEDEEGEILLGFHSEKLATTYGIISTTSGTPIRIMKNLRVCSDCHNFMKFTSRLLSREIIVRDIQRFHHFKQGHCSCGDYW